jgi:hypothetical protein
LVKIKKREGKNKVIKYRIKSEGCDFATLGAYELKVSGKAQIKFIQGESNGDLSVYVIDGTRISFSPLRIFITDSTITHKNKAFDFHLHHPFHDVGCPCLKCDRIQKHPEEFFHWSSCKCGRCEEGMNELECFDHCSTQFVREGDTVATYQIPGR